MTWNSKSRSSIKLTYGAGRYAITKTIFLFNGLMLLYCFVKNKIPILGVCRGMQIIAGKCGKMHINVDYYRGMPMNPDK